MLFNGTENTFVSTRGAGRWRWVAEILGVCFLAASADSGVCATLEFQEVSQTLVPIRDGAVAFADFDNDGDLDLIVTGNSFQNATSVLYRNDGGKLVSSGIALPGFRSSSVEWGDFDNDGFVDLLLSGISDVGGTQVYRNLGGTNFVSVAILPAISGGRATWGDYNQDGLLDIAVQGGPLSGQSFATRVYLNQGGGRFAESAVLNPGMYYGTADWSDFDLDGDLDLLAMGGGNSLLTSGVFLHENQSGTLSAGTRLFQSSDAVGGWIDANNDGWPDVIVSDWPYQRTQILTNAHDGRFLLGARFPYLKTVVSGDFDNDGKVDLLSGVDGYLNPSGLEWVRSPKLFATTQASVIACGDWDGDGRLDVVMGGDTPEFARLYRNVTKATNQPPEAPQGLVLGFTPDGKRAAVAWAPSKDPNQASGLTYNVRIGTSPGLGDLVSPMSAPNGFRRIVRRGNAEARTNLMAPLLTPGRTYYWSVQAVDQAYAGSPFAAEQSFYLNHPPVMSEVRPLELNEDGEGEIAVSVADLDSAADQIQLTASADLPSLVPPEGLSFRRDGTNWTIRVRPGPNQNGTATLFLKAADETGRFSTAVVTVRVLPVNDRPVVTQPALVELAEDTQVSIPLPAFDVDADPLTYSITRAPLHGTVSLVGGVATYRPATNYFGTDAFSFTVSDAFLTAEPAQVLLTITPVVDVPTPAFQVNRIADGSLEFFIHLDAYQHYRVESSTDLVHWEERLVLQSPTGDLWFYDRTDVARCFFRCTAVP